MDNNEELKEVITCLINKAEEGKHTEFETISNFDAWLGAKQLYKAEQQIVKIFTQESNRYFDKYLLTTKEDQIDEVDLLIHAKYYADYAAFYQEECNIIAASLKEFSDYG